jgi:SpoVK/Ycf46/Vps4 family AAA+-type ATPase
MEREFSCPNQGKTPWQVTKDCGSYRQLRNRAHQLDENEIAQIVEKLDGYSGADIEDIIEEAAFLAFQRRTEDTEPGPIITKDDITKVIEETPKSVTSDELQKLKRWAMERGLKI